VCSRDIGGMGFGLVIVKYVCVIYGGEVIVWS